MLKYLLSLIILPIPQSECTKPNETCIYDLKIFISQYDGNKSPLNPQYQYGPQDNQVSQDELTQFLFDQYVFQSFGLTTTHDSRTFHLEQIKDEMLKNFTITNFTPFDTNQDGYISISDDTNHDNKITLEDHLNQINSK
jgi:hypothetical protein